MIKGQFFSIFNSLHKSIRSINFQVALTVYFTVIILFNSTLSEAKPVKMLVFSKTNGFRHKTISVASAALTSLAKENNWVLTFTEDSTMFSDYKSLKNYKVVIFLYCTGKILGIEEEKTFSKYIEKGGSLVTIHTGTDCEQNWDWYMNLIGAKFKNHPKQQQARFVVNESSHLATKFLPNEWLHFDELYNFSSPVSADAHILLSVDEGSYNGGTMGNTHPMVWCRSYKKGRVFQTALGHTDQCYTDKDFLAHFVGGIKWTLEK